VKPRAVAERIRALALSWPLTYEDAPWGNPVFKVGDNRLFAMLRVEGAVVHLTVKLTPEEREVARSQPNVRKAAYVGRYGWVTVEVTNEEQLEPALEWLRESYWLRAPAGVRDAALREE
jgi:predicted DNA-binding protein (MmcQ/YjbR family)